MPVRIARSASSSVMAGSLARFLVPSAMRRLTIFWVSPVWQQTSAQPCSVISGAYSASILTPTSMTSRSMPKYFAIELTPVRCLVKLMVCESVTDCGAEATPSLTTPLSADMMTIACFCILFLTLPVMPASCMEMSSNLPSAPVGLARTSCRARAASMALSLKSPISSMVSKISLNCIFCVCMGFLR